MAKTIPKKGPKIILSGIQPTGKLHLGNYLGAIKPWVKLQNKYPHAERYYSIVDLHALSNRFTRGNNPPLPTLMGRI